MKKFLIALCFLGIAPVIAQDKTPADMATATARTVKSLNRTWRVNVEMPYGSDVTVQAYRERLDADPTTGDVGKTQTLAVSVTLKDVAADSVTLKDGTKLTVSQINEGLLLAVEAWTAKTIAATGVKP